MKTTRNGSEYRVAMSQYGGHGMIIDSHHHQILSVSDEMIRSILADSIRFSKIVHKHIDYNALYNNAKEIWPDPDGEKLIRGMDEAGIDFTIICGVDNYGSPEVTSEVVQKQNKTIADIAKKYPDRIAALAGVDPRRKNAVDIVRECVENFGMKGLKYHPDKGFDPCGPESYSLLGIVNDIQGILLCHTGPLGPPARCKFSDPMMLADIGVDFPEIKVIAAHMGYANWRRWAGLAAHQPNFYGDLAMWDLHAFGHFKLFCRELRDMMDFAGSDKILFGTDDPVFKIVRQTDDWIKIIKELPETSPTDINFTNEEIDAVLGQNAAKILGLPQ
jgi:predicted TIM-barrel fold metal-dependent hydrolase